MNYKYRRVDSSDPDFQTLVRLLDAELASYNGERDEFYSRFNTIQYIKNAILIYDENDRALACGAFKKCDGDTVEIKRMYVRPESRRLGLAVQVLAQLEIWAKELGYSYAVLETGDFLPGTIALYQKCGFEITPNYGQYVGVVGSVCFRKTV